MTWGVSASWRRCGSGRTSECAFVGLTHSYYSLCLYRKGDVIYEQLRLRLADEEGNVALLEQQVNKNVTFTYITNIATANQVIVRVEWALDKNWSAVAVRDENGLFGLDFFYKKRFK